MPLEPYDGAVAFEMTQQQLRCVVLAASDPNAVLGVTEALGLAPDLVMGVATSTEASIRLIHRLAGWPSSRRPGPAGKRGPAGSIDTIHSGGVGMENLKVQDFMATEVRTLGRNDHLALAQDIMKQERIRHFPVLEGESVVGVVSQRDLFHATLGSIMNYGERSERAYLASVAVKEVMRKPAITISAGATLREAASRMVEERIGCLPVVEGGKLVGILTETDILRQLAGE